MMNIFEKSAERIVCVNTRTLSRTSVNMWVKILNLFVQIKKTHDSFYVLVILYNTLN